MARPIWPKVPSSFVSSMLAGHSALGLLFAALIYIVCLSGTLLVLDHEIDRWENPNAPIFESVEAVETPLLVRALGAGIEKAGAAGTRDYVSVTTPADGHPNLSVRYADFQAGLDETFMLNDRGEIVGERREGFGHFMEHLHFYLHLPQTIGLFVVGLIGVALLSSVWSGVFSHPRIFRDAFRFRRGGTRRLEEADLHNRLSVWGLPFHIIVPLTGAILGLSTLILGVLAMAAFDGDLSRAGQVVGGPRVAPNEDAAPIPDVAPMIDSLLAEYPDAKLARLGIREFGTAGQSVQIDLAKARDLTITDRYIFDGDGTYLGSRGFSDGSLGNQVIGALGPLHFGWFSEGWVAGFLKAAYLILGLALTFITSSGVAIWIARRRDKGKPVPGWERAWIAAVWGQPLSYSIIAGAALLFASPPLLAIWLAVTALSFAPVFLAPSAQAGSKWLRGAIAISLVLVVTIHLITRTPYADAMAWVINGLIILTAIIIGGTIWSPLRRSRPAIPAAE
ncbi:PepSY-associated TM helix domain-containing protein [Henriciella sp. AS95]|uniref:PepSY-associated TM helix domain-containing protein n=1 Tax=Henriciella sp. AS95 TaxID=3135782 RepID=UPI0031810065